MIFVKNRRINIIIIIITVASKRTQRMTDITTTVQILENQMMNMTIHTSCTRRVIAVTTTTNTTSRTSISSKFTQRPSTRQKQLNTKTVNRTIINNNKVLTMLWKLSRNHAPFIHRAGDHKDKQIILYKGLKLEF